jgi:hypothetical protein
VPSQLHVQRTQDPLLFHGLYPSGISNFLPDSRSNAQSWNAVSMQHAIQTDLLDAIHV